MSATLPPGEAPGIHINPDPPLPGLAPHTGGALPKKSRSFRPHPTEITRSASLCAAMAP
ncbi:hypothetical protein [Thermogymnomonas acidicola]|uniref:hypothetical protein n=1 Tax=Thermogymnomonas acidicola TaxID=399579 RepID=UPI0014949619|nr:hypothetical protein [Thermogymnomonas acidicola]